MRAMDVEFGVTGVEPRLQLVAGAVSGQRGGVTITGNRQQPVFVQRDLASGRLVAPLGFAPGQTWIVALTPREGGCEQARLFRDWLLAEGASTPLPPEAACDSRAGR